MSLLLRNNILHPPASSSEPRRLPAVKRNAEYQQDLFLDKIIYKGRLTYIEKYLTLQLFFSQNSYILFYP